MINPIEYLLFQARLHPEDKAIQQLNGALSFAQLLSLVRKTASRLRKAGIRPGQIVVTCLPERLGWIMTLALFHEAAISCSNHGYAPIEQELGVDYVVSNRTLPEFSKDRTIFVDSEWLSARRDEPTEIEPNSYEDENSICRLILTSGTTGHRKAVPFSIAVLRARLGNLNAYWSSPGTELNMMPISTVGGFVSALNCIVGATALHLFNSMDDLVSMLHKFEVTSLIGSPAQLAALVRTLQDTSIKPAFLTAVRYAGGPVSPALLEEISGTLCPDVFNVYGSTEIGGVCSERLSRRSDDSITAGFPIPTIEIEVVDELGHAVEAGQEGVIRARGPCMAHGYFRNEEETRKFFRHGWFYPGDRGRFLEDGLLVLSGRDIEIINCGGVKIDPLAIDQFIVGYRDVIDAAVFGIANEAGMQEVAAALVVPEKFDLNALNASLMASLGPAKTPKQYFRVNEIPRNQMGKVLRAQISRILAKQTAQS